MTDKHHKAPETAHSFIVPFTELLQKLKDAETRHDGIILLPEEVRTILEALRLLKDVRK